MFAIAGVAGLYALQAEAARRAEHDSGRFYALPFGARRRQQQQQQQQQQQAPPAATTAAGGGGTPVSSPVKQRPHAAAAHALRDGALVCFKDKRGQVAVVQPYNKAWQLAPSCAAGGCCNLSAGASLAYLSADAVFLVCRLPGSNTFAFRSLGAEGRYLSTQRDLAQPPVVEPHRITPAAQWRITSSGITNAQHGHKKLGYVVHELRAVPQDALSALDACLDAHVARQHAQLAAADASSRALDRQLQDVTGQLVLARQEHADALEAMAGRLSAAVCRARGLEGELAARNEAVVGLQRCVADLKRTTQSGEAELNAAYAEITALQQQVAEAEQARQQDQDLAQDQLARAAAGHKALLAELQQQHNARMDAAARRHEAAARHWAELREVLEGTLLRKDEEIAVLSEHVSRLSQAIADIQRLMHGSSRRARLDRASLDAVSIQQLQVAVAQFAATGDAALGAPVCARSHAEAEALRTLLESQVSEGSGEFRASGCPLGFAPDSCGRDLGRAADQTSPSKSPLAAGAKWGSPPAGRTPKQSPLAADRNDSPLVQLAASSSSSDISLLNACSGASGSASAQQPRGRSSASAATSAALSSQQTPGVQGSRGAAEAVAAGCSWSSVGMGAGGGSWAKSVLRRQRSASTRGSAASGDGVPAGTWGTSDVAVSGSSRRAGSSAASEEHGVHRYSLSSDLSDDGDASSQEGDGGGGDDRAQPGSGAYGTGSRPAGRGAGEVQDGSAGDDDDLDAIHTLTASLEVEAGQQLHVALHASQPDLARIGGRQLQPLAQQPAPLSAALLGPGGSRAPQPFVRASAPSLVGARRASSSGSLEPVREEHHHQGEQPPKQQRQQEQQKQQRHTHKLPAQAAGPPRLAGGPAQDGPRKP